MNILSQFDLDHTQTRVFAVVDSEDPSASPGLPAGLGSLCMCPSGLIWKKTGSGNTAWTMSIPGQLGVVSATAGIAAATTSYLTIGAGGSVSESLRRLDLPFAISVSQIRVATTTTQPANGSLVLTLRKNGVDTAGVITIPAGSVAGSFSYTGAAISFAARDLLGFSYANNSPDTLSAVTGMITFLMS